MILNSKKIGMVAVAAFADRRLRFPPEEVREPHHQEYRPARQGLVPDNINDIEKGATSGATHAQYDDQHLRFEQ